MFISEVSFTLKMTKSFNNNKSYVSRALTNYRHVGLQLSWPPQGCEVWWLSLLFRVGVGDQSVLQDGIKPDTFWSADACTNNYSISESFTPVRNLSHNLLATEVILKILIYLFSLLTCESCTDNCTESASVFSFSP